MAKSVLDLQNVVGFGDGKKRVNRKSTNLDATIVFVEKKTDDIPDDQRVPKVIDGKITDVVEIGKMKSQLLPACKPETMQLTASPLKGGLQVSDGLHLGTLGAIVKDRETGKLLGLTNAHVAYNPLFTTDEHHATIIANGGTYLRGRTAAGKPIYQSNSLGNLAGEVVRDSERYSYIQNTVDASLFSIRPELGVTTGIMGLSKYPQTFTHPDYVDYGTTIYKSGRTTGLTSGELLSVNATINVEIAAGVVSTYTNQVVVLNENGEMVSEAGDSGSTFCVDQGDGRVGIIGLLAFGSATSTGSTSAGARIDYIVNDLSVLPWNGELKIPSIDDTYVSAGMGSVYEHDGYTMLDSTNTYVCGSADSLSDIMVCVDGDLSVQDSHITQSSSAYALDRSIELRITKRNYSVSVNADCALNALLAADVGEQWSVDALLLAGLEYDVSIDINTSLNADYMSWFRLASDYTVAESNTASALAEYYINCSLNSNVLIDFNYSPAMPFYFDIQSEGIGSIADGYSINAEHICGFVFTLDAVANNDIDIAIDVDNTVQQETFDGDSILTYKWGC